MPSGKTALRVPSRFCRASVLRGGVRTTRRMVIRPVADPETTTCPLRKPRPPLSLNAVDCSPLYSTDPELSVLIDESPGSPANPNGAPAARGSAEHRDERATGPEVHHIDWNEVNDHALTHTRRSPSQSKSQPGELPQRPLACSAFYPDRTTNRTRATAAATAFAPFTHSRERERESCLVRDLSY